LYEIQETKFIDHLIEITWKKKTSKQFCVFSKPENIEHVEFNFREEELEKIIKDFGIEIMVNFKEEMS
jgi:hypothetical protein